MPNPFIPKKQDPSYDDGTVAFASHPRNWTPGPWVVLTVTCEDDKAICNANGNELAMMAHPDFTGFTWETTEANATLMATAPDLYEALVTMTLPYAGMASDSFAPEMAGRLKSARAALAKAHGKNPEAK